MYNIQEQQIPVKKRGQAYFLDFDDGKKLNTLLKNINSEFSAVCTVLTGLSSRCLFHVLCLLIMRTSMNMKFEKSVFSGNKHAEVNNYCFGLEKGCIC